MPFLLMFLGFVLLYKSNPSLFAWDASGFRTVVVAILITAFLVVRKL